MTRLMKLLVAVSCVAFLIIGAAAEAATPAAGTISKTKKSVIWKGTATLSSPTPSLDPVIPPFDCEQISDPNCDHFALKIDLGEGAKISVSIKTPKPANEANPAQPYDDWDFYLYAPDGSIVARGESANGNESVAFVHKAKWRKKAYTIAVRPWLVLPGSTYTGTVKAITLGK